MNGYRGLLERWPAGWFSDEQIEGNERLKTRRMVTSQG
jgi:hypothetical protein